MSDARGGASIFFYGGAGQGNHLGGTYSAATVEISPVMRSGHISLPNGFGVTNEPGDDPVGVAPNELTSSDHRDPIAGTPYHKHVPARLEPLPRQETLA